MALELHAPSPPSTAHALLTSLLTAFHNVLHTGTLHVHVRQ